jgi:two-component sensor histidine kinase
VTNKEDFLESENARLRALLRQAGLDPAESDVAHKLHRLLLSEMHHRIKNVLAMVQSIVVQSLRSARTPAEASEAITYRIAALARTQDIIMSTAGEGSPLELLLEDITAPFGSNRFRINVPSVVIPPKAAVALALTVNELATNAIKYGALSVPDGGVVLAGRKNDGADELVITWSERGGPAVQEPTRRNFGTQLILTALPGEPTLEFRPIGVYCEMRVPLPVDDKQVSNCDGTQPDKLAGVGL